MIKSKTETDELINPVTDELINPVISLEP